MMFEQRLKDVQEFVKWRQGKESILVRRNLMYKGPRRERVLSLWDPEKGRPGLQQNMDGMGEAGEVRYIKNGLDKEFERMQEVEIWGCCSSLEKRWKDYNTRDCLMWQKHKILRK